MVKQGKLNKYSEKIGNGRDSTWNAQRMQNALSLEKDACLTFCPWTNDAQTLLELDVKVFSQRPDLKLEITRRWNRDPEFGYNFDGKALPGFFENLCQIMLDTLSKLKNIRKLKVDILKLGSLGKKAKLNYCDDIDSLAFLSQLTELETLELHGNFKDLPTIAQCKKLKRLVLEGNEDTKLNRIAIDDMSFMNELHLESLFINLAKLGTELQLNPSVKSLIVANCNIDNTAFLRNCPELEELILHRLDITHLDDVAALKKLKTLSLECCKSLEMTGLEKLSSLEYLKIIDCKSLKAKQIFEAIITLPNLKKVVGHNDVKLIKFNLYEKLMQAQLANLVPASMNELPAIFGNSNYLNIY